MGSYTAIHQVEGNGLDTITLLHPIGYSKTLSPASFLRSLVPVQGHRLDGIKILGIVHGDINGQNIALSLAIGTTHGKR